MDRRFHACRLIRLLCVTAVFAFVDSVHAQTPAPAAAPAHNIIIFVADGLRHGSVDPETMPTMAQLRKDGVDFVNSHSLFPTVTTPNASAIATGHYVGDTGNFANAILLGYAGPNAAIGLESNTNLAQVDAHFSDNYLGEESLLAAARAA